MASMAKATSASRTSRLARWRSWVQAGFLLVWLQPSLLRLHAICSPVFHCHSCQLATFACPIGVLAQFSALHLFPFLAVGTLLVFGALFGSFVCGWACPFGFLQDLIARFPTPKFSLPDWTGHFRFVVLGALVLAVPFLLGEFSPLFFCRLCPAGALEAAVPYSLSQVGTGEEIVWPSVAKMVSLGLVVSAMLFSWRPWCKVLCPLGAIFALMNRVSLLFMRFHPNRCRDCAVCRSLCHDGQRADRRVDGLRCVRCLECAQCRAITVETALGAPEESPGASGDQRRNDPLP